MNNDINNDRVTSNTLYINNITNCTELLFSNIATKTIIRDFVNSVYIYFSKKHSTISIMIKKIIFFKIYIIIGKLK